MKKINFKRITVKNFLSIGKEPVVIEFKRGLNLIVGLNKDEDDIHNGAGKSAVLDAFYFAIFGSTIRELPKQFIINRQVGKGASVRLELEDVSSNGSEDYYIIERTLGPSKCKVWKNDIEKTKSTVAETNKYILEILSADEDVFQNCIVMRANSTVPFMGKKKVDKKSFIESIFNLGIFTEMTKLLKDDIRGVRTEFDVENSALSVVEKNIESYNNKIAEIERQISEQQDKITQEKKRLEEAIANEENKLKTFKSKNFSYDERALSDAQEKIDKANKFDSTLSTKLGELSFEMRSLKKQIQDIDKIGNVCPTCKREYPEEMVDNNVKVKGELVEKLKGVYNDYKNTESKQNTLREMRSNIQKIIDEQKALANEMKVNSIRISNCENTIKQYNKMISSVESRFAVSPVDAFVKTLNEAEKNRDERKLVVNEIQEKLSRMNVCEHIFSEGGVRSYIVNTLLELLNGRIKHYLRAFKSMFDFTFNEFFEESITDSNGTLCMYNNCSGAEMKKIDLAISFAFLDIIKFHRQVEYNVSFYDEILDSSVDNKSLENIIEFITERAQKNNSCVYIVTHKTDLALPQLTETVLLEKKNGYTTRNLG